MDKSTASPNIFAEVLSLAHELGLSVPHQRASEHAATDTHRAGVSVPTGADSVQRVITLRDLERRITTVQLQAQELSDAMSTKTIADKDILKQRTEALAKATDILHLMVGKSSTLAMRFKDVNSQQTIPVEADLQEPFSQLLLTAASEMHKMANSKGMLAWAAAHEEPPRAWETHLAPITALLSTCSTLIQQLDAMKEAGSFVSSAIAS